MKETENVIRQLRDFFKEFDFSGNSSIRFMNTLFFKAKEGKARDYVINYFKLIDSPYANAVVEKTRSKEFKAIIKTLKELNVNIKPINQRFVLYYGNQGTGKTTKATELFPNAKVMNCNSNFEPNDLLETFDFENGSPTYKPSPLFLAMNRGDTVILDEINLLTRDCLRSLQAFLDNKECFEFKGETIKINDGFKVIGTMNLEVNGQVEALPAPLVDRAEDIVEFELSDKLLAHLALEC